MEHHASHREDTVYATGASTGAGFSFTGGYILAKTAEGYLVSYGSEMQGES